MHGLLIGDNNFYCLLKLFIKLGYTTNFKVDLELSNVDLVAKSILLLADIKTCKNETYHIFNNDILPIKNLATKITEAGKPIIYLEPKDFINRLLNDYKEPQNVDFISELLFRLDILNDFEETAFLYKNDKSNYILSQVEFSWVKLTTENLLQLFAYCKQINFIE